MRDVDAASRDAGSDRGDGDDASDRTTPVSEIKDDVPQAPGRVDAGEAVTGSRAIPGGESAPGGIPGDDSSLEGGNPA